MADVIQFPAPASAMEPLPEHLEIAAAMVEAEGFEVRSRVHSMACAMTTEYRRGLQEGSAHGECRPNCNEGWEAAKAACAERDELADEIERLLRFITRAHDACADPSRPRQHVGEILAAALAGSLSSTSQEGNDHG